MTFDYHCSTSKFDVKIYDCTQYEKEYEAKVHFQQILLLCNLLFWLSFCVFYVISTRNEFYFMPPLFDRPWERIVVPRYTFDSLSGCLELCFIFAEMSGCEQPCNISQIITDTGS
jgi:hypothetical protein